MMAYPTGSLGAHGMVVDNAGPSQGFLAQKKPSLVLGGSLGNARPRCDQGDLPLWPQGAMGLAQSCGALGTKDPTLSFPRSL